MVNSSVQKWRYPVMTNVRNANGFFYDRAARGAVEARGLATADGAEDRMAALVTLVFAQRTQTPSTSTSDTSNGERVMLASISDDRSGRKEGRYREYQLRVQRLFEQNASRFGITEFFMWTYDNIKQTQVYAENRDWFDQQSPDLNGRAFKPLTIYHALMALRDGDYLIYTDCSPEMWQSFTDEGSPQIDRTYDVNVLKRLVVQNGDILTSAVIWQHDVETAARLRNVTWRPRTGKNLDFDIGDHTHAYFTTDKCMQAMGLSRFGNSLQHASGVIAFRKSFRSVRFVSNWLHWNLNPDCASVIPFSQEADRKLGHRTDQSISGLLVNEMNGSLLMPWTDGYHNPFNLLSWSRTCHKYEFIHSNADPTQTRWKGWHKTDDAGNRKKGLHQDCCVPERFILARMRKLNMSIYGGKRHVPRPGCVRR